MALGAQPHFIHGAVEAHSHDSITIYVNYFQLCMLHEISLLQWPDKTHSSTCTEIAFERKPFEIVRTDRRVRASSAYYLLFNTSAPALSIQECLRSLNRSNVMPYQIETCDFAVYTFPFDRLRYSASLNPNREFEREESSSAAKYE